ncbi:MAG: type II toxin-antitoxin system VapB family antitoxin [Chloroflexi bacterium]|nr:type II toxin-antitoxin system VapB family antitoxin [Chloroflexota bacterium]
MRRTVVIQDSSLDDARRLLGTKGIQDTVEEALREVIRREHLEQLRNSLGKVDLGLTSEELTKLRNEGRFGEK